MLLGKARVGCASVRDVCGQARATARRLSLRRASRRPGAPAQESLDALGPAPRAELLHVLTLPDLERVERIGEFWGYPQSRTFAELLTDCEEDRTLRAVLVGMLRETDC